MTGDCYADPMLPLGWMRVHLYFVTVRKNISSCLAGLDSQ